MNEADDKGWRDFRFTIDVILAAAYARADAEESRANTTSAPNPLKFNLLAASTAEEPVLPTGEWRDTQQLVSASIAGTAGNLRLAFQAIGYAAMTRVAGRAARMVSHDGEIEVTFRFDGGGRGIAVLADKPGIRRALADFSIVLD
jgi:hypothetical protein